MNRKLGTIFAATLLTVSGLVAGAAPATADVWGCSTGHGTSGAYAVCTQGSGQYRVAQQCQNWLGVYTKTVYGAWVNLGQQSSVNCGWDVYLGGPWVQSR